MVWKRTVSPVKKKFCVQWSVKKVMLTVFWDVKGLITFDFLENDATANSFSYCQLLWQNNPHLLNDPCIYCFDYKEEETSSIYNSSYISSIISINNRIIFSRFVL